MTKTISVPDDDQPIVGSRGAAFSTRITAAECAHVREVESQHPFDSSSE
jgi:hypothetical protein